MAFIEQGRQNLREREAIGVTCKEIFDTSISLLRKNGKPNRDLIVWKYQAIDHRVNSTEPPVRVYLSTGANIDKAKSVWMRVQGVDYGLRVTKKKKGDKEIFEGKKSRGSIDWGLTFDEAQGLLTTVKMLQKDIQTLRTPHN